MASKGGLLRDNVAQANARTTINRSSQTWTCYPNMSQSLKSMTKSIRFVILGIYTSYVRTLKPCAAIAIHRIIFDNAMYLLIVSRDIYKWGKPTGPLKICENGTLDQFFGKRVPETLQVRGTIRSRKLLSRLTTKLYAIFLKIKNEAMQIIARNKYFSMISFEQRRHTGRRGRF